MSTSTALAPDIRSSLVSKLVEVLGPMLHSRHVHAVGQGLHQPDRSEPALHAPIYELRPRSGGPHGSFMQTGVLWRSRVRPLLTLQGAGVRPLLAQRPQNERPKITSCCPRGSCMVKSCQFAEITSPFWGMFKGLFWGHQLLNHPRNGPESLSSLPCLTKT